MFLCFMAEFHLVSLVSGFCYCAVWLTVIVISHTCACELKAAQGCCVCYLECLKTDTVIQCSHTASISDEFMKSAEATPGSADC